MQIFVFDQLSWQSWYLSLTKIIIKILAMGAMMTACQAWKESLALECHQLYTCPYVSLLSCIMLIVLYLYLYLYLCLSVCVMALTYHAIQIFLWLKLLNWKTIQTNLPKIFKILSLLHPDFRRWHGYAFLLNSNILFSNQICNCIAPNCTIYIFTLPIYE